MSSSSNFHRSVSPILISDDDVSSRETSRRRARERARERAKRINEVYDKRIYEVFLSFRGEDTRASFTSHLHTSLNNIGIKVFKDDHSLQRGDIISTSLMQAIEQSKIAVIVFSRNYAESRWCLKELVKIMECHRTTGQVVLPVFYDVDPSEVRHQTGEFGKAFFNVVSKEEEKPLALDLNLGIASYYWYPETRWRMALREAAALAGFVVLNSR